MSGVPVNQITAADLDYAKTVCLLEDLAEDLGGWMDDCGIVRFERTCDLDAFCELLAEAGATIINE